MSPCDPRVELKVCTPHQPVRLISARLSGQIRALQSLWPAAPKKFIFNGLELLEGMTFDFYGIRDGDSIVALPIEQSDAVNQWIILTRDHEGFNESLRWMLDPATAGEAARLRDLHLMRLDRRPRVLMKMYSPLMDDESPHGYHDAINLAYEPPRRPSTEALPTPWDRD
jgi:hypothetical protein